MSARNVKEYQVGNVVVKIHEKTMPQKDAIKQACARFIASVEADKCKAGA